MKKWMIVAAGALCVAFALLFSWEGAKAQTLKTLTHDCEKLENFWQQHPTYKPNEADAATCYGYLLAIGGFTALIVTPADGNNPDCSKGSGPNCRHALSVCFPVGGVSYDQGLAVFLAYARNHAPEWHEPAWRHVQTAMMRAFPCKGEYPETPK